MSSLKDLVESKPKRPALPINSYLTEKIVGIDIEDRPNIHKIFFKEPISSIKIKIIEDTWHNPIKIEIIYLDKQTKEEYLVKKNDMLKAYRKDYTKWINKLKVSFNAMTTFNALNFYNTYLDEQDKIQKELKEKETLLETLKLDIRRIKSSLK